MFQVIILDEDRKAARVGQETNSTVVDNLKPDTSYTSNTSAIPNFPTCGMEPACTAADLPPEVRRHVLLTIREEEEENSDNEGQDCGSNNCGYGNDCYQTNNVPGNDDYDDDDLDDYPFDY